MGQAEIGFGHVLPRIGHKAKERPEQTNADGEAGQMECQLFGHTLLDQALSRNQGQS